MNEKGIIQFSIVIPLYNKENHIKRAISSVLRQTYKHFELLIIDDGSTDNSLRNVEELKDERIRIIKQANKGVAVARNKGIENSRYEYICFLDADDMWELEFLSNILNLINMYPSAGMYATAYNIQGNTNTRYSSYYFPSLPNKWVGILDDYFKYAINFPIISASSVVIAKSVFLDVRGFPEGIKRGEDLEMWRRIALKYPVAYYNYSLATYFHDSDNRTCNSNVNIHESSAHNAVELYQAALLSDSGSEYYKEYLLRSIYIKATYLIRGGKRKEARFLLLRYRKTKYNKKLLITTFIKSFI